MLPMVSRSGTEPEPRPAPVAVRRLALAQFRCYGAAELSADARPVVLTGPNGAGKTNLLEAVSFLAPGRGLRGARLAAVDRRPPGAAEALGPWAVSARIDAPTGEILIRTGREAPRPGEELRDHRRVLIDGVPAKSQTALAGLLAVVWLTPQMDRLLQEGSAGRRRFLDRLVFAFDPGHAARVSAYEQAWRERQRLIEDGAGADPAWLDALEARIAEAGVAIAAARRALVQRLARAADAPGPFPRPGLAVEGMVEAWLSQAPALEVEERFRAGLAASRAPAGGPVQGPHRSDLAVTHRQKGIAAELASTGEQKALLVAIMLAHARLIAAERGAPPILLLDEVAAHLDAERRAHLFAALTQLGAQAWMTGTDEALFRPLGHAAQFFRIKDAAITPDRTAA